ncbi:MAG: Flavodoxin [Herbinix sp.]|jgi:flavodoxin|nr:Flavodoxin [Herbinix sp.]
MRALVVYYSLEGDTDYIAKKIAKLTGAELLRLTTKKEYPTGKVSKFFWGGKSVVFGEKPGLEAYDVATENYDTIFIGTPIWAGTYTPPIRTFLSEQKISGKNIYLFACHMGGGADKCFKKLTDELKGNTIVNTMEFYEPYKVQDDNIDEKVKSFCNVG